MQPIARIVAGSLAFALSLIVFLGLSCLPQSVSCRSGLGVSAFEAATVLFLIVAIVGAGTLTLCHLVLRRLYSSSGLANRTGFAIPVGLALALPFASLVAMGSEFAMSESWWMYASLVLAGVVGAIAFLWKAQDSRT
jgi:hypothetical protein